jgi:heme/copper-type cytochrome/quinol oxidase subunit 2
MKDTAQQSIKAFKNSVFIWEVVITLLVFTAVYFIFKSYKSKEKRAADSNKQYEMLDRQE